MYFILYKINKLLSNSLHFKITTKYKTKEAELNYRPGQFLLQQELPNQLQKEIS